MANDTYDLVGALEPPKWKGVTGKLLSVEEWSRFQQRFEQAATMPIHEQISVASDYLNTIFPRNRVVRWKDSPADEILKRPDMWVVLSDFFGHQLRAMSGTLSQMKTSGNEPHENRS